MGVNNRQRRKQKQRREQHRRGQAGRHDSRGPEPSIDDVVMGAVAIFLEGDPDEVAAVVARLHLVPVAFAAAVERMLVRHRTELRANGWTDDDLTGAEARRVKVPAGASAVERDLRTLAFLVRLPPLPPTEPRGTAAAGDEAVLAKIRALLAKAESTTFPAEAEALTTKAQQLMARHRVDRVLVATATTEHEPVGRRIWLDDPYLEAKARLLAEVAAANQCWAVLLDGLGCSHVVGFAADLDVVEILHTSLLVQATSALAAAGPQRDARGRSRTRSFRQSFLVAYADRVGERLRRSTDEVTAEVAERSPSLLPALTRRDDRVREAAYASFPGMKQSLVSITNPAGWLAGTVAADAADLAVGPPLAG